MQVGQTHVGGVLGGRELVDGRDEAVRLLLQLVQEAQHTEVWTHCPCDLGLVVGLGVILRAILLLLWAQNQRRGRSVEG